MEYGRSWKRIVVLLCIVMAARDRGPRSSLILPQSIDQRGHWKRRERDGMRGAIEGERRKRAVASAAASLLFPELIFQGLPHTWAPTKCQQGGKIFSFREGDYKICLREGDYF